MELKEAKQMHSEEEEKKSSTTREREMSKEEEIRTCGVKMGGGSDRSLVLETEQGKKSIERERWGFRSSYFGRKGVCVVSKQSK